MAFATIDKGSKYFNTVLYTGTGASLANTGVGFQPDLVWIKGRSGATDHGLYDAVRGVQKDLVSNATSTETTQTTGLTAFGFDGFTVGALAKLNTSAATYVAWNWLGANTTVSNTSGSISSTVSANTTSGFSIVSWTGNGVQGATVGHGLGVVPKMVIAKSRGSAQNWWVTHANIGATQNLWLNSANAVITDIYTWSSRASSTVLNIGDNFTNGTNYIAYCFAEIKGYSKFGSYTGNGSTDGTFVYTGFKPAFMMIKNTTVGDGWQLIDAKRNVTNGSNNSRLEANNANSENVNTTWTLVDLLSNGFKQRYTDNIMNASGSTYIYMAFAENPFVSSKGIPTTAR
jgi:hypothetical protein